MPVLTVKLRDKHFLVSDADTQASEVGISVGVTVFPDGQLAAVLHVIGSERPGLSYEILEGETLTVEVED